MPTDERERDFEEVSQNTRLPGRFDPHLLQNIDDVGDGYPGLQKMVRDWVKYYLSQGIVEDVLDLNSKKITNILDATLDQELISKSKVDTFSTHKSDTNAHIDNITDIPSRDHDDIVGGSDDDLHHTKFTTPLARSAINDIIGSDGKFDSTLDMDVNAFDNVNKIILDEIAEPDTVGSHGALYVDSTSHYLSFKDKDGNVTIVGHWKAHLMGGVGGSGSTYYDVIETFDKITGAGVNSTDKGDLLFVTYSGFGIEGSINGFYCGGSQGTNDVIQWVNLIVETANAADGGDLLEDTTTRGGSCEGATYGFIMGGYRTPGANRSAHIDVIDHTVTSSNATDKGDLTGARDYNAGISGGTYGFSGGGQGPVGNDMNANIDYINVTTITGNATDKGDLLSPRTTHGSVNGNTYGFFAGGVSEAEGWPGNDSIEYINITTTTGDAVDKGDLSFARNRAGGSDSVGTRTYGYFSCGYIDDLPDYYRDVIDYLDVTTTTGNAVDKGDSLQEKGHVAAI